MKAVGMAVNVFDNTYIILCVKERFAQNTHYECLPEDKIYLLLDKLEERYLEFIKEDLAGAESKWCIP